MPINPGNWPDFDIETEKAKDYRQEIYFPLVNLLKQRVLYTSPSAADMKAKFPAGTNWFVFTKAEQTLWIWHNGWQPVWAKAGKMTAFNGVWYSSTGNTTNPWAPIDINNGTMLSRYYIDPRNNIMDVHYVAVRGSSTNAGAGNFAFWSPRPFIDYRTVLGAGTVNIGGQIMNCNVIGIDTEKFALNLTKNDARVAYDTKNASGASFSGGDTIAFSARVWVGDPA